MEVLASMGTDPTSATAFLDFLVTDVNKGKVSRFFLSQWKTFRFTSYISLCMHNVVHSL